MPSNVVKIIKIDEYVNNHSKWRFVKIQLPKVHRDTRRKLLYKIIDDENAKGLIELYETGLVYKSNTSFYAIIIY